MSICILILLKSFSQSFTRFLRVVHVFSAKYMFSQSGTRIFIQLQVVFSDCVHTFFLQKITNITRISPDITQISPEYHPNITRYYPNITQYHPYITQISPGYHPNITRISSGYHPISSIYHMDILLSPHVNRDT